MLLAMRDVPGLLELVLLQHLPLDVALRFAMTTLTRYVIFIVGLVWAFGTIEIGWSKVQWLVAAVSVGLGFGLQEIFANFVSGLIILFERPLRAGDIVTIDGVTGTVKNVRLRATIIQDLDRKDFIVPNKDFITGRLLNWTLSDEVSRIVINVGVAYGSDTEKAKSLMLAAAQNHPLIAKDPPAQVTFEAFGDSSLNLVLRCFISLQNMPGRMRIVDELHTEIDRSFHTSSIEIPFPQRDLHLRSIDTNSSKLLVDSNNSDRGSTK
jgi:potassium efflux system protein